MLQTAGSIRRQKGFISDIDLILVTSDPGTILERLRAYFEQIDTAETKQSLKALDRPGKYVYRFKFSDIQVDMYVCLREELACMQLYLTGSKYFNIRIRRLARTRGFKLTNRTITKLKNKALPE